MHMKKTQTYIKNSIITIVILGAAFGVGLLLQNVFEMTERTTVVFVFAVFLISLWTDGYIYGILAAFCSVLLVNYAFTFPFYAVNFIITENFLSAIIMIVIAILTSMLTTKIKRQEAIKAESDRERMRANLLRAVSHDLRTPLTTIYGSAATLLENREILQEEQQTKILQGIKEDSEWLVRMVENLLSITRIDSGKVKIIKMPMVLDELIDSVMSKFKKRYPEQEVAIEIPEDIIIIPMDAILIEQVILNILENAVQHAIEMTELSLKIYTTGQKVTFEVRDNGLGISEERLSQIFNGYFADDEQPSDGKKHNAGIGLSVCATIIRAHGGEIYAENLKDGGAVFRFILMMEDIENDQ